MRKNGVRVPNSRPETVSTDRALVLLLADMVEHALREHRVTQADEVESGRAKA